MFLPPGGRRDRQSRKNPFLEAALQVPGTRRSCSATDTLRIPSHRECHETRRENPPGNRHIPRHLLRPSESPAATAAGDTPPPTAKSVIQIPHTTLRGQQNLTETRRDDDGRTQH